MKSIFKQLALAGAIAVAFATPAAAAVSSSAAITDFSVTLFDLNPGDGISPTLTWTDPYGYYAGSYTTAYTYDSNGYGLTGYASNWAALGSGNGSSATLPQATATATVASSAQTLTPSGILSASGNAYATPTSGTTTYVANAYEPYYNYTSFMLSANTLAVFSATAVTHATTTVGYDWTAGQSESASASASLNVNGQGASGNGSQSSYDTTSSSASYVYDGYTFDPVSGSYQYNYLPMSTTSTATLAGSFVNTSMGDLTGHMYLAVQASGSTNVVAVPEPESFAMLLAGLGIIGAIARRRQSR